MKEPRKFPYQEEIKIIVSEVLRTGEMTDNQWTQRYEYIKSSGHVEELGFMLDAIVKKGYDLAEASAIIKNRLQKGQNKFDVENL